MVLVHFQVCTIIPADAAGIIIIFTASDSMRRKKSTIDTMVTSGASKSPHRVDRTNCLALLTNSTHSEALVQTAWLVESVGCVRLVDRGMEML